ncbi:MAG TPA: hypothetical protein VJT73_17295 [Polyangiaceae bacterium]|nr:hypothetical protein [Polyangiaceae bacterium]
MNTQRRTPAWAAAAVLLLPASAIAQFQQQYEYDVGPNYINQSASSCRTESRATEADVYRSEGRIQSFQNSGHFFYCPLTRRGTTYYGVSGGGDSNNFANVTITVKAEDTSTGDLIHCESFRSNVDNGTVYWGAIKFLCWDAKGCTSAFEEQIRGRAGLSYVGSNTMVLQPPAGAPLKSLNHGYRCFVPALQRGALHYAETKAFANE